MSYSSKIDLRLSEVPKTANTEIFADLVDVYNAIHILGQYTNVLIGGDNSEDSGDTSEQLPFKQSFWVKAAVAISSGQVITVTDSGAYLGCNQVGPTLGASGDIYNPGWRTVSSGGLSHVWGIALSDAAPGERVRVGIGSAILKIPGVSAGSILYGASMYDYAFMLAPIIGDVIKIDSRLANDGGVYANVVDYHATSFVPRWQRGYSAIGYAVESEAVFIHNPGSAPLNMVSRAVAWA